MSSIHGSSARAPRPHWSFILVLVAGAAALGLSAGCQQPKASSESAAGEAKEGSGARPKVTIVRPERKTVRRSIKRPGYNIEAYQSTPLYAKISGYVKKWYFDIGDPVRQDQILAELDVPEMEVEVQQKEAAVAQAEAEIRQARAALLRAQAEQSYKKTQYGRLSRVSGRGVIDREIKEESRFSFEAAQAAVAKAQADIAVAEARLRVARKARDYTQTLLQYTKIRAPFDGVITKHNINDGDLVQPPAGRKGEALFVVDQEDPVRVFVNVPELEAVWVRRKDKARVRNQALRGQEFTGTVTRTARALDPTTRTLRTEIDLPNPEGKLLPGMYVDVTIVMEHPNVWALPASAVVLTEEGSYCYRLKAGKVVRTPLQIGLSGGKLIEVLKKRVKPSKGSEDAWEDFTGQEEIVRDPTGLSDGQPVRAAGKE
jgi:multidrug efflux pump subunit AcrA (membrane-fusion protein)